MECRSNNHMRVCKKSPLSNDGENENAFNQAIVKQCREKNISRSCVL